MTIGCAPGMSALHYYLSRSSAFALTLFVLTSGVTNIDSNTDHENIVPLKVMGNQIYF